jgi:hypothetical protein
MNLADEMLLEDEFYADDRRNRFGFNGGPNLKIDPLNGDLIEDFGDGMGMDLNNGDLTVDAGPFGFDL